MRFILIAALCLAAAACSKSDSSKLSHDVEVVGHDIAADTKKAADDPAIKQAGAELKGAGEKADAAVESAAEKAKVETAKATDQARAKVHEATADKN